MKKRIAFEFTKPDSRRDSTTRLNVIVDGTNVGGIPITGPIKPILDSIDRLVKENTGLEYSRNGIRVVFLGAVAAIIRDGTKYHGRYTDPYPRRAEIGAYADAIGKMLEAAD